MEVDPGETKNLYKLHPEVVQKLMAQLEADISRGCSTAGPNHKNDVETIKLWKGKVAR